MTTLYGIKNCSTMKKAFDWLAAQSLEYNFHDYKKTAPDVDVLRLAFDQHGWESVINRRGMTWRNLDDAVKANMDEEGAMAIALEKPSIIKRPLLLIDGVVHLGFDDEKYTKIFA